MSVTLSEIKHSLLKKEELHLYFSTTSFWWTHRKADIEKITAEHKEQFKKTYNEIATHEMATQEEKDITGYNFVKQMEVEYYGPSGERIYIQKDANKFIKRAEENTHNFDEFGLEALMKAHHENCNGQMFNKWPEYNKLVAADKGLSEEEHKAIQDKFNGKMADMHIRQTEMRKKNEKFQPKGFRKGKPTKPNITITKKKK